MFSQQISVDNTVGLQQLIEDNLVDGCVDISNIASSVNGIPHGLPSYGYFERASSNFPFENGIVLSTGNATSAGNGVISPTLSEGSSIWGTDPDLETALGTTNTQNATSIEFDIVSTSGQFQFNYLFASEDYDGINPCQVSDGFVFLIKETGSSAPYQNIALVPGTSDPVNTGTIHTNLLPACAAQNEQYFDGYNLGDTNYIGRTTVLTASTTVTPLVSYHVKLIIADQTDGTFDSAVFIEGNSFKILDLGEDIATCASSTLLDADIQNPLASYEWFIDGVSLIGENDPTHLAIESGTYRVEVTVPLNGTDCVEDDEIIIVLNTEEAITPISDYELCDDSSDDGIEIFDLSTKNAELIPNIPFTNYTFSYHFSEAEARGNINETTTPIPNPLNPQIIFVRVEDLDSNCFAYTSFNLIVNPLPTIVPPTTLEICDTDDSPDGFAIIDLTVKDDEITAGNTNLNVTYHYNPTDASNGDNPIPSPYINTSTPTSTVYARVVNLQTGCVNNTTLDVDITVSPIVNRDTQYIDACDTDLDGSASFDLTQVIADILNGLPASGVTITFHESSDDAQIGANAIANETNYQNLVPNEQTLYVRVEDNTTGCASVVPLEIHTNLLLTGTDTGDFALCDTNDDDNDTLDFNLNTIENFISNNLPDPVTVTFFESESDRDNNIGALDKTQLYAAVSPTVLYIRLDDGNCSEVADITLLVNPILLFTPTTPIPYCDTDDDGIVSIDLHSLDDLVTNGNTNFRVDYFPTQFDADNNTPNQLPPFYTNTNPVETIYARIEHILTGCSTVNPFDIQVFTAPPATQPQPHIVCDNDQDGFSIVNLEDKISEVLGNPIPTTLNINFFTSFDEANTFTNPIPSTDLATYNTNTQIIYIRVESNIVSTSPNCHNIVELEVIVNTLPIIPPISDFQICQTGGSNTSDFLLVDKDAEILDGQTGKEVFYFEDAAYTIPINKNNLYPNTSSPQTIYVRVENITDSTCSATSSFLIQVSPDPIYNPPTPFLTCDDISNDEIEIFDLDSKIAEISQGSTDNLNISFHLSQTDAENSVGALTSPYTNISNPQTLYTRIESDDSLCFVVEEISLNIVPAPYLTEVTAPLIECDADYDGLTPFNLEDADFEILDRIQTNLIVNYFENEGDINQNDGLDNTNEIIDPTNFISNSQTVYIKVANTLTSCFSVIPLELIVNLPPTFNTIGTIEICDNDTDTYDLSQVDNLVVDDTSVVNISYHNSQIDAEDNLNPLTSTFNYTANNHTIFIRLTDINNGCPIVTSFNLQINQNPIANTPPDLIECDDDFDGILVFNLPNNNNAILGLQDPTEYTITFYSELIDAEQKNNALNNSHPAVDGELIFARLENNNTGCYVITQFSTFINPKPFIPINDIIPLCTNDLPLIIDAYNGNPNDTYLWSTGETTSQIQLNDPSEIGNYWVTVTTPNIGSNDCTNTKNFEVIESEIANINFTTTVDFADPNSITVDISGIGNYEYVLDNGEPQTSNVFNNVTLGEHIVTIIDLHGCMPISTTVFVIDIPKFVTPNNDGAFDTWHIVGANQLPGSIVYIYNRYGKLLKTLPYTSSGWDGTFNGQNMPADDYWFVAKVVQDGNAFDIKGHFSLKR